MMKSPLLLAAFLAVPLAHAHGDKAHAPAAPVAVEQTAWGIAGNPARVGRTVTLDMTDVMRFTPDRLTIRQGETVRFIIRQGETVRFIIRNTGRMLHEMVIGTPDELVRHAAMMARFPNMEHDLPYMAHVALGKAGEIVWHFNRAGTFEFACLIAGHFEAGMRGTLTVPPT